MSRHVPGRIRRAWQRVRTVPGLGRDVGVVVGLVVAALGVGGYILSHERIHWPGQKQFVFAADFREAPSVSPGHGQEVRIAGVVVGDITKATVTPDGHARLTLAIKPQYKVYRNARLVLRPQSPLNSMYVEMNPGGPPAPRLHAGQVIPVGNTSNPVEIDQVLQHLDQRTRDALSSLLDTADTALVNAPQTVSGDLRAADATVVDLRPVVTALQERRDAIRRLVTALSQIASAAGGNDTRLAQVAGSLQQTLDVLAAQNDKLRATLAQLPGVTDELRRATTGVQHVATQLNPTLDDLRNAAGVLPPTLNRLTSTVQQIRKTVRVAGPVVAEARPVVADLRPFVGHANPALVDLSDVAGRLDPVTARLVPHLPDVQAFVYNVNSIMSLGDANGGYMRGLLYEIVPTVLSIKPQPGQ